MPRTINSKKPAKLAAPADPEVKAPAPSPSVNSSSAGPRVSARQVASMLYGRNEIHYYEVFIKQAAKTDGLYADEPLAPLQAVRRVADIMNQSDIEVLYYIPEDRIERLFASQEFKDLLTLSAGPDALPHPPAAVVNSSSAKNLVTAYDVARIVFDVTRPKSDAKYEAMDRDALFNVGVHQSAFDLLEPERAVEQLHALLRRTPALKRMDPGWKAELLASDEFKALPEQVAAERSAKRKREEDEKFDMDYRSFKKQVEVLIPEAKRLRPLIPGGAADLNWKSNVSWACLMDEIVSMEEFLKA